MARVSDSARRRASGEHGWRERGREAARQRGSEAGRQRGNGAAARPAGLRPLCPGAPTPGCGSTPGSLALALGWWQGSSGACAGSTTSRWPSRCSARRTRSRSTSTTWSVHQCPPVPTHPGGALADGRPLALPRAPSCTRSAASVVARSLARSLVPDLVGWLRRSRAPVRVEQIAEMSHSVEFAVEAANKIHQARLRPPGWECRRARGGEVIESERIKRGEEAGV